MPRERGAVCVDIGRIREALLRTGVTVVRLLPFFTLAGVHANADLAGDKPESWRRLLETAGIRCRARLTGLIEREAFAAVWRDHLERALARLD